MNLTFCLALLFLLANMPTVDCTKLKYDDDDKAYLDDPKKLFTGKCECFHANGKKSLENNYKEGELDGKSYIWYPDGKIQLESRYLKGRRVGLFTTYYPTGKKESETLYGNGNQEKMIKLVKWKENGEIELKIGE